MNKFLTWTTREFTGLTKKEYFWYFIFPFTFLTILIGFYFSGKHVLTELVCPEENREWGIVENLQNLFILAILVLSIYAVFKKNHNLQKVFFVIIAIFSVFIFLEEIDYGAHIMQFLSGRKESFLRDLTGIGNIHNEGNNAKIFKRLVYGIMLFIFLIAPLLREKIKNKYILYLTPKTKIVLTLMLIPYADLLPRFLIWFNFFKDGGFGVNIGEFSEIIFYYIFLLYLIQLVWEKEWPGDKQRDEHFA